MKILIVSPYHGGSHQSWAEGYQTHSHHDVDLLTLPARFWKWRMHGGAVTLARQFLEAALAPDLILATDMLDLSTFLALTRRRAPCVPAVLYMHENQLTYPLPSNKTTGPMRRQRGERDLHYAFINYASMMAADRICFNSQFHYQSLLQALPDFLKHFPEFNELDSAAGLEAKSSVLPVGIHLPRLDKRPASRASVPGKQRTGDVQTAPAPLILWNQRWEYDKNPTAFFKALYTMAEEGIPFRLALCGQRFRQHPEEFEEAVQRFEPQLVHVGYAKRNRYHDLLWQADITISTAYHEFFGISILEAIYCHTFPLLPNRLSYPELLPAAYHHHCLYQDDDALVDRLRWALTHITAVREIAAALASTVQTYDWTRLAPRYDAFFEQLA